MAIKFKFNGVYKERRIKGKLNYLFGSFIPNNTRGKKLQIEENSSIMHMMINLSYEYILLHSVIHALENH